tara:strand:+ start:437 stop:706 length:270 start_codon:yes stop_codon:yes gene_type:complete
MVKKYNKKSKTLKVKRSMLKKTSKKTSKKTKKRVTGKKGGAVAFPSRYFGAAHDIATLTSKPNLSTADPMPANSTWNSFSNVGPLKNLS